MTPSGSRWNLYRGATTAVLLAGLLFGGGCRAGSAPRPTAVFLVRHAEKATGVRDPSLTEAGLARARALARTLADAGIETIYSTEFARTRETAQAVAEATGREVRIFPVGDSTVEGFLAAMAAEIRDRQAGRTVLVVGHSNTVPGLMRALGAKEAGDLTEEDYDDLFLLELDRRGSVRLRHLHYGTPSR